MPKKTFDDLTIEEKFKAVREDIVTVGGSFEPKSARYRLYDAVTSRTAERD